MQRVYALLYCDMTQPARPYFSTLSHKWHDFRKTFIEHKTFVLIFFLQLLSETFLILRGTERDIVIYIYIYIYICVCVCVRACVCVLVFT